MTPGSHRCCDESGFALASTVAVLAIILIVTAIGARVAISAIQGSDRDRSSADAFTAAESALDITTWRMNRLLVANEAGTLASFSEGTLQTLGCVAEDAAGDLIALGEGETCELDILGLGNGVSASCATTVAVDLDLPGILEQPPELLHATERLLVRPVICSATIDDVTRRIYARLGLRVRLNELGDAVSAPLSLWRRYAWVECSADVNAACPPA